MFFMFLLCDELGLNVYVKYVPQVQNPSNRNNHTKQHKMLIHPAMKSGPFTGQTYLTSIHLYPREP